MLATQSVGWPTGGIEMRALGVLLLAFVAAAAYGSDDDAPIQSSAELRDWCKTETEAYFVGQGAAPSNWTATHATNGNTYQVNGKWRVEDEDVEVECRAAKGAPRKSAVFEVGSADED
jgi:hypothetical protein